MSEAKVRVGILGGGSMGAEHAQSYCSIESVEVVGVFSRNHERATAAARICNARPVTDPSALLDDPTVSAIDVCLPSVNHREFVIKALQRGKHVFCETPFALRAEDASAMVQAARDSKRILMVGLLMRSIAGYEHVRRVALSGELGKVLSVTAYRLGSYLRAGAPDHKDHYSDPSTELMTFDFDFVQWLMGMPIRVSATAVNTERGTPGEISAMLDYDGARNATILASGLMPNSFPFSAGFRVVFEKGAFDFRLVFEGEPPKSELVFFPENGAPEVLAIPGHNPFEKELRLFADCVRGKADPALLDAQQALATLSLSIATQRSLQERGQIDVDSLRKSLGI